MQRKEGGRGLINIKECIRRESKSFHRYPRESTEWMLQAALKEKAIDEEESLHDYERRRKDEEVKNWKEKALHGAFVQQISDEAGEKSRIWLICQCIQVVSQQERWWSRLHLSIRGCSSVNSGLRELHLRALKHFSVQSEQ